MVINEALASQRDPVGVDVQGVKVSALAFADDLVLCASTAEGLQCSVNNILAYLKGSGLRANPGKCCKLSLGVDKKAQKWFVSTSITLSVDGVSVPSIGPEDAYKYLGILVGPDGKRQSYGSILEDGISNLTRAPLKPHQRLELLVNHLIPRLVLGKVYRTQLSRMDRRIRLAARSWLKLPSDVPDAMLYSHIKDGELGIPNPESQIRIAKQHRPTETEGLGCIAGTSHPC